MRKRPSVARNTERMLWAESIGHCMNPQCQAELIEGGVNVGEMAHIEPHSGGGDVSFENLILLCRRCHKKTGNSGTAVFTVWKANRNLEIKGRFTVSYSSFNGLRKAVTPILERNRRILENYGPFNDDSHMAERQKLWRKFESEIICNNRRLELMLGANKHLLHQENQDIVDQFVAHAREFVATRENNLIGRALLFPQGLLSIFGLSQALFGLPPNLSALQNFVSSLIRKESLVSLDLNDPPCVTYLDAGKTVRLMLEDRPRLQQVFWNGRFFRPSNTDVRIANLVFFAQWLSNNRIEYAFCDMGKLTDLTLNGEHEIRLCHKYLLSLSDVQMMELEEGNMVVNLHNWNSAPISKEAHEYASQIGVRLFSQNDFFKFAHKELK